MHRPTGQGHVVRLVAPLNRQGWQATSQAQARQMGAFSPSAVPLAVCTLQGTGHFICAVDRQAQATHSGRGTVGVHMSTHTAERPHEHTHSE